MVLHKRRKMIQAWADYLDTLRGGKIAAVAAKAASLSCCSGMKLRVLPWIIYFIAAIPMVVAGKADVKTSSALIGAWAGTRGNLVEFVSYSSDGKFRGHVSDATTKERLWDFEGKWTIEGDWLRYWYTKSEPARVPVGFGNKDQILELDADHFRVRTSEGDEDTFTRATR
jgi:hypothetical protein